MAIKNRSEEERRQEASTAAKILRNPYSSKEAKAAAVSVLIRPDKPVASSPPRFNPDLQRAIAKSGGNL